MDIKLAAQLAIGRDPLEEPIHATALDGCLLCRVTHRSVSLQIMSGDHTETLTFHLIYAPQEPSHIGVPLVNKTQSTHRLVYRNHPSVEFSLSLCLKSALSSVPSLPTHSEFPDLSKVPGEYLDLKEVFNKTRATSLLQRFLGFANFYRRFIRNYSSVAASLSTLTSPGVPFQWSLLAEKAFSELKARFTSAPILVFPDPGRQLIVEVDASDTGVGAILSQRSVKDQKIHLCAFFSRKLSPAESGNYDIGNRELLAVKLALEEWRY